MSKYKWIKKAVPSKTIKCCDEGPRSGDSLFSETGY